MNVHKNSTTVIVKKKFNMIHKAQVDPGLVDYLSQSKSSIGSYLRKNGNGEPDSGLSPKEENLLLPQILALPPEHLEFMQKKNRYYDKFTSDIPFQGLKLEIGLQKSNNQAVSETNMPISLEDYIRYRHIKGHPQVAESEKQAERHRHKTYYLEFPGEKTKEENQKGKLMRKAGNLVDNLLAENNQAKMMKILRRMGVNTLDYTLGRTEKQVIDLIESDLNHLSMTQPEKFIVIVEDPDLEYQAQIDEYLIYGVLMVQGNTYYNTKSSSPLGNRDAVLSIVKNPDIPENSEILLNLNSNLETKKQGQ